MKVFTLPDAFIQAPNSFDKVLIHDYVSLNKNTKNKVSLSHNLISFILEGQKEIFYVDNKAIINQGYAVIMPQNNCLMTENLSPNHSYKSLLFFFDKKCISDFIIKHKISDYNTSNKIPKQQSLFIFQQDDYIKAFLQSIQVIHELSSPIGKQLFLLKFEEIILYLLDKYSESILNVLFNICQLNVEQQLRQTIESNIYSNLTLQEISFLCNVSIATFKRHFKKLYGMPPHQWFQKMKMQRAVYLIQHEQARPSEIYFDLGYENLSSFTLAFKNEYGITPSALKIKQ